MDGGEVRLIGTLDTTNIERGQRRIVTGFDNVKSQSQNATTSLTGLKNIGEGLAGAFSTLSVVGVGALTGLAMNAPQTAGALASMEATTRQLSMLAGEELAPAFDYTAQKYSEFVDFLAGGSPMAELVKDVSFLAGAGGLATIAGKLMGLKNIGKITIPLTIAVGAISAADKLEEGGQNLGEKFAGLLGAPEGGFTEEALGRSGGYLGYSGAGAVTGAAIGSVVPIVGTATGAVAGTVGGLVYGITRDVRETFFETDTTGGNQGG